MKSIAEFKRKMIVGSQWVFVSSWSPKPITRTCTISQSNSFALTSVRNPGENSWCDWPKAKEVTFVKTPGEVTKVRIEPEGMPDVWLTYTPIE